MTPLLLSLLACGPGDVTLTGRVLEDRATNAPPLAQGTVTVHDADGERYDEAPTGPDGAFAVLAPRGRDIHAVVRGPGLVPASFAGQAGMVREVELPDGELYGFSAGELAEWETLFEGCPGVGEGGAFVGRLRYFLFSDTGDEPPPVETPTVTLVDADGHEVEACYLDDAGEAYAPDAEHAGESGVFGVFGLPEGVHLAVIRHGVAGRAFTEAETAMWVPGDGVVPRFPQYVEFPTVH